MTEAPSNEPRYPNTVRAVSTFEVTTRKSRFLAYLMPSDSKEVAQAALESIRKEHWEAAHHCHAYRLGLTGQEYRMSDDGEPSGTAGKPILFALQRAELTNVILIVVRYFGGVRLGVGPLARAFTEAATGAIQNAEILQIVPRKRLMLNCEYDDVSRIVELLKEVDASYEVMYTDAVQFDVVVDEPHYKKLTHEVVDRTAGRAGYSEITAE